MPQALNESTRFRWMDGLRISLTFWVTVGMVVWLAIALRNALDSLNGDLLKVFAGSVLIYACLGLILWLPVSLAAKLLIRLRLPNKSETNLNLGLHALIVILMSALLPMHHDWFPGSRALSPAGMGLTVGLLGVGALLGFLLTRLASGVRRLKCLRAPAGTLLGSFILLALIWTTFAAMSAYARKHPPPISAEDNRAYPTGAKVLLLGFDAATWEVIDPLLAQGRLPNFARLLDGAVRSPLQTSKPTLSAILWATVATGKDSRGHGIHHIVSTITPGLEQNILDYPGLAGCNLISTVLLRQGYLYMTPVSSGARRTKAVWNILTDYEKQIGVVGWWGSYPPEPVHGVIVSDHASLVKNDMRMAKGQLSAPADLANAFGGDAVFPAELASELEPFAAQTQSIGLEELNFFVPADSALLDRVNSLSNWDRTQMESAIKLCFLVDKYFRLSMDHLLDTREYDLMMGYFFEADGISHWFWPHRVPELFPSLSADEVARYGGIVDSTYINVDRVLGDILDHAGDGWDVIIVSDHGFGVEGSGRELSWGHDNAQDGVLIMKGPHVTGGASFAVKPRLEDITPTILTLLGIPVGDDMAGRTLLEAIDPAFLQQFPPRSIPSHDRGVRFKPQATSGAGDAALNEKLRALGYIN